MDKNVYGIGTSRVQIMEFIWYSAKKKLNPDNF